MLKPVVCLDDAWTSEIKEQDQVAREVSATIPVYGSDKVLRYGVYTFPFLRFSELCGSAESSLLASKQIDPIMAIEAIVPEVVQLNLAGDRVEASVKRHPPP